MGIRSIDVLLATRNGAGTLPRVFAAWERLESPGVAWRAVVVDNASDDGTREIIRQHAERLPIRYVFEGEAGKNRALNSGLAGLEGDLVVVTDDDAVPHADWLVEYRRAAENHPEAALFGGAVYALWSEPRPDWIEAAVPLGIAYTVNVGQVEDGPIEPGLIFGPNMAVRRAVFEDGHRFDETIGPGPGQYAMGSEYEFNHRLAQLGYVCRGCPRAVVGHIVRPHQYDRRWILDRSYRFGRLEGRRYFFEGRDGGAGLALALGFPRYLIREYVSECLRWVGCALRGDAKGGFGARWEMNRIRGHAFEFRRSRNERSG